MISRLAVVAFSLISAAPSFAGHTIHPLRVVDGAGVVIGSLASTNGVDGTSCDPARVNVLRREGKSIVGLAVCGSTFHSTLGPFFYHTTADCSAQRYLPVYTDDGFGVRGNLRSQDVGETAGRLYFPGTPVSALAVQSVEVSFPLVNCVTPCGGTPLPNGLCCIGSPTAPCYTPPSTPVPAAPVTTIDVSTLLPPFTAK